MKRRTSTTVHHLKAGEPLPVGAPTQRGIATNGYVYVGWVVANQVQVRCYENRYVMGNPIGDVHHKNGIKTDNRPDNLELLPHADHGRHHHPRRFDVAEAARLYEEGWSLRRVGKQCGVSDATIVDALKAAGIQRRTKHDAHLAARRLGVWTPMMGARRRAEQLAQRRSEEPTASERSAHEREQMAEIQRTLKS